MQERTGLRECRVEKRASLQRSRAVQRRWAEREKRGESRVSRRSGLAAEGDDGGARRLQRVEVAGEERSSSSSCSCRRELW